MKVNPWIFGILIVAVFLGTIGAAKAAGTWSVSGKISSSGEKVMPTGANPDEIKGWMTLSDIAKAYNVPVAEILAAFDLPADTPETAAVKDLESDSFSTIKLRTWMKERLIQ